MTKPGSDGYRKTESRTDKQVAIDRLNRRIRGHIRGIAIANRDGDEAARREHARHLAAMHDEMLELFGDGNKGDSDGD